MGDYFVRAATDDGWGRAFAAVTTNLVGEAAQRHSTSPTATAALGRALTAVSFIASDLKAENQRVTLRVMGSGPLGAIVADGNSGGHVRGYVQNPAVYLPPTPAGKLDVGGAVGADGLIHVTRDLGLRKPYTGSAPLLSGEIAEDLANYYWVSEQRPTSTALGVLVAPDGTVLAAGGLLLEALPGAPDEVLTRFEANSEAFQAISRAIESGATPEYLVEQAFRSSPYHITGRHTLQFYCHCDRDRVKDILASIGRDDLQELAESGEGAELVCHFCGEKYWFDAAELEGILREQDAGGHDGERT